ncbi:MAG: protein translocase subunit SecY [Chitinophagales bacterium]|nr:MAG: protein translocase subunit SecY [Chitinophagales bacterium]
MKGFITTLKNIWQIEDLRARILATLGFVLIYRVGSFVVLPGINPAKLDALAEQGSGGILGLVNLFAGGAFSRASVFALGIMPYISASIAIQLLTIAVPYFQKLQKEGESGRRQINQITRWLTVLITAAQASGYVINLKFMAGDAIVIGEGLFWISTLVVLTAGTIFVMWLGEKITDKGIGNGISLIIMIGIIAHLPFALTAELSSRLTEGGGLVPFLIEIVFLVLIVIAVIALVQATRRIPVQYAKRIVGNKQYGGVRQYLPLKVNAAGVMPIIFAQALMFLPATIAQFIPSTFETTTGFLGTFSDYTSVPYNIVYFFLVILFTYFYTAIIVNPMQWAEDLKKNNGFIPGVKPGKKTAEYIDAVMSRITLPGAIFLALVAILPAFAQSAGVNTQFAIFFGGTSLLILVSVILDTLQQIESHLLMRHYDGLMKSGRIKGRQSVGASV